MEAIGDDLIERIKQNKNKNERKATEGIERKLPGWTKQDELILWEGRIYVPKNKELRAGIIKSHHDSIIAGHPGRERTRELITRNYWWPRIRTDVNRYVEGCQACQRNKIDHCKVAAPLNPNETPVGPWRTITQDIVGPLPESQGYNAIAVITDMHTKRARFEPIRTDITSIGWAKVLRDRIFRDHGIPEKIISDPQ